LKTKALKGQLKVKNRVVYSAEAGFGFHCESQTFNRSHSMGDFLPLFPLSLVVYPGESFRLHIFEDRYKQLISECVNGGITFGVCTVIDQTVSKVATEVRVMSVDREYNSGEMDVSTEGIRRFEILNFYRQAPGKLYAGADISWLSEDMDSSSDLQEEVYQLLEQLHQAMGIQRDLVNSPAEVESYQLGHQVGFTLKQEYEMLSLSTELDRLAFIKDHITSILPVVKETERLKAKAKLNGHYKDIIPPTF
jgi:ATP-dependent Lon protease